MAFVASHSTRTLAPDATCRPLAIYQEQGGGRSGEKQCKGYLLEDNGNLSGELITDNSLRLLQRWENKHGKIAANETEHVEAHWVFVDKVSWGANVRAKIASLLAGGDAGVGRSSDQAYVARGVREIYFKNGYNGFMNLVKPKNPGNQLGLVADKKGRTVIFVVVKLLVADEVHMIKKSGNGLWAGFSAPELATIRAAVGNDASSELYIKGSSTNPVILKRTFVRMAWDKDGNPLMKLHGSEKHDGIGREYEENEVDEDVDIEVEEEGLLNLEDLLKPDLSPHS